MIKDITGIKLSGANFGEEVSLQLFTNDKGTMPSEKCRICNLYGKNGLLDFIFQRIQIKEHCVIVVSDGARFSVKDYKTTNGRPVDDIGLIIKKSNI